MSKIEFIEARESFHESVRGWAFFPFQAEAVPYSKIDGTSYHVVMTNPGEVRGNHLHPEVVEWLHVFGGPAIFHWRDEDGTKHRREINNDHTIIRIEAGIAHAVSNPSPHPVFLVAFRSEQPSPDLPVARPAEIV